MPCKAGGTQSQKHFVSNHIALKINLKQNYSWPAQNETMIYNSISVYIRVWQFNSTSVIRTTFEVEFIINAHLHCIFEPYEQGQISSPCNYLHFGFTRDYDVHQLQDGFKEELNNKLEDWKKCRFKWKKLGNWTNCVVFTNILHGVNRDKYSPTRCNLGIYQNLLTCLPNWQLLLPGRTRAPIISEHHNI